MRQTTAPSGVAATNGGGKAMTDDPSDRLGYVLDELSFPVHRWELIAAAQHYGADPATLQETAHPARRALLESVRRGQHRRRALRATQPAALRSAHGHSPSRRGGRRRR